MHLISVIEADGEEEKVEMSETEQCQEGKPGGVPHKMHDNQRTEFSATGTNQLLCPEQV